MPLFLKQSFLNIVKGLGGSEDLLGVIVLLGDGNSNFDHLNFLQS